MRLDKFLKVSRLIKRRTVANEACDAGRVQVNGTVAKASVKVKTGRRHRNSVWYPHRESGGAGYSGYNQKGRGKRIVQIFVIFANNLS